MSEASPHTRGWTRWKALRLRILVGFPAHAGMDPGAGDAPVLRLRLPRTRGDGPVQGIRTVEGYAASPHTRGWTRTRS